MFSTAKELESIGVVIENLYVSREYTGPDFIGAYHIYDGGGIFVKNTLMVGVVESLLGDIAEYLKFFSIYRKLHVNSCNISVKHGDIEVLYTNKFNGVAGKETQIRDIVRQHGGNSDDADFFISGYEEKTVGFIPQSMEDKAFDIVNLVNAGANRPATTSEIRAIEKIVRKYNG